ncbi:MAG: hypothetical protein ACTHNK_06795 [Thermomicrobiales bacterium]|jgi:hypothetical protein|nr:hypothetical protein [Thermomicrobiales bacterium]
MPGHDASSRGASPERVQTCLEGLLAIEGVLGAAVTTSDHQVAGCLNMNEQDAAALDHVVSAAVRGFEGSHQLEAMPAGPTFVAFELREGQIAVSSDQHYSIIALAEPELDAQALRGVLDELLANLAQQQ